MTAQNNEAIGDRIMTYPGVLAVRVQRCNAPNEGYSRADLSGPSRAIDALHLAARLFETFDYKKPLRISCAGPEVTISCMCENGIAVVVIAKTGHVFHKSMHRTVTRLIKSKRAAKSSNTTSTSVGDNAA